MQDSVGPLEALLLDSHLAVPEQVPVLIDEQARRIGARSTVLYLVDLDQRWLLPLPPDGSTPREPLFIDGTLGGRCYRSVAVLDGLDPVGNRSLWVPVVDGTERLGVLHLEFPADRDVDIDVVKGFTALAAELVISKSAYGDYFWMARRRRPLTVASELLWQLLPPLTFATKDLVISAVLLPTADLGGDAFDYGVDRYQAQVAIFDAVGHGLEAGLIATTAIAAYRNSRREQLKLGDTAARVGSTIEEHCGDVAFATGVLLSLDIASGRLSWCVAGHPPPLVVRRGRVVKTLEAESGMPFGLGPASAIHNEQLEPGDRLLLYSDGITEAQDRSGNYFELDRLIDLVARTAGDDPVPERMRRLMQAVEAHNDGPLRDDATVVMIEWRSQGEVQLEL